MAKTIKAGWTKFHNGKVTVIMNGETTVWDHRYDAIDKIGDMWRDAEGDQKVKLGNILDHLWNQDRVCTEEPSDNPFEPQERTATCSTSRTVNKSKDPVVTVCYGQETKWASRRDAKKFYLEGISACEGSEQARYLTIYAKLCKGETYCTDEED